MSDCVFNYLFIHTIACLKKEKEKNTTRLINNQYRAVQDGSISKSNFKTKLTIPIYNRYAFHHFYVVSFICYKLISEPHFCAFQHLL